MRTLTLCVPFLLATLPLPAQSLLHSHSLPLGVYCSRLRPAGDTNGDGKLDFVAITRQYLPTITQLSVVIVSGATGAPLHTLPDPVLQNDREAVGIGDVNGDGRSDVLLVTANLLRVYSGMTGQVITSLPPGGQSLGFLDGCGIGDYNGNGTADVAVGVYDSNTGALTVRLLRGENLSLLGNLATVANPSSTPVMRAIGDITGDGRAEIAYCRDNGATDVLNGSSGSVMWSLSPTGSDQSRSIDALDLDGDGKRELFFFRPQLSGPGFYGMFSVHDAVTGAQRFARQSPVGTGYGTSVAAIGDLDQDGVQDFAQTFSGNGTSNLLACSGVGGRRLWALPSWPQQGLGWWLAPLGDVDGDTFGDVGVMSGASAFDGWHLISGKILAESQPQGGACGGGPFFPQLGASRPILGQTMTIAGQNGPAGVPGLLVFSLQPPAATWLGVSTCYAYFDFGSAIALAALPGPQWSLPFPIPLIPQGAGFEIALQAFYAPTSGPLGLDLSNGVWARLGYQ